MCQAEVAHHANKSSEYFVSRPEKHVHFYKKAVALTIDPKVLESESAPAHFADDDGISEADEGCMEVGGRGDDVPTAAECPALDDAAAGSEEELGGEETTMYAKAAPRALTADYVTNASIEATLGESVVRADDGGGHELITTCWSSQPDKPSLKWWWGLVPVLDGYYKISNTSTGWFHAASLTEFNVVCVHGVANVSEVSAERVCLWKKKYCRPRDAANRYRVHR
jgi:hypothetical protein